MEGMESREALQYPIGRFVAPAPSAGADRSAWIETIAETPRRVEEAVAGLSEAQLDTPYREGGWTVRQVVHHYADDHMNSYVRFKWALTEDAPVIKGYLQEAWAELADARSGEITPSLALLKALHLRWVTGWKSLSETDWKRVFVHPARGPVSLEHLAALYSWHGLHHVAQIVGLRKRNRW